MLVGLSVLGTLFGRAFGYPWEGIVVTAVLDCSDVVDGESADNRVRAKALHTVLTDALLFAAPQAVAKELPMLGAVWVEAGGGHLVAAATDRSVLGVSRVQYSGAAFTAMISVQDVRSLARIARTPLKRDESWREATITLGEGWLRFDFNSGEDVTVKGMDVDCPQWRNIVPDNADRMGGIVGMGYQPRLVGKFTKVRVEEQSRGARMVMFPSVTTNGRPGPTVVRIGEDFIGVLMPFRAPSDTEVYVRPSWFDEGIGNATEVRGG